MNKKHKIQQYSFPLAYFLFALFHCNDCSSTFQISIFQPVSSFSHDAW